MEGYWMKLDGDLSKWLFRFVTDTSFRLTTNKRTYALASYFNKISPNKKVNVDTTILKESEEFVNKVNDFFTSLQYFLLTQNGCVIFPAVYGTDSDEAIVGNFIEAIDGGLDTISGSFCYISYCMALYPEAKKQENLNGFIIPAETKLFIHQYGINKHKAHWSNPEEFDHDRLLIANQKI
ncbi:3229_t:CDS:2 [Funneliformis caledonium]|uniref:3229_t:CDS:1 n=1 Tax=Funneliformis caledonium TaxID=1117310 RepID=A0A9N9A257_9GLOM|nr:3229_t:CDS:2 [Funneliformis caledonium]